MSKNPTKKPLVSYSEKLKDPRWQRKRLEILERDNWACQVCGNTEKTLHVHHTHYIKQIDPWDHPEHLLITLCEKCHSDEHGYNNLSYKSLTSQIKKAQKKGFLVCDIDLLISVIINDPSKTRKEVIGFLKDTYRSRKKDGK